YLGKIRSDWGRKQPKTCVWVLAVGGKGILQRSHSVNARSLKNPKGRLKTLNQDFQTTFFI
ncbi:MAG: hypothetical protein E6899_08790, partial [Neisseria sp.]|nr:hypothetical protein [Neisseria sp.]